MSKAIFVMQIGCVLIQFIYFLNKTIKYYKKNGQLLFSHNISKRLFN